MGILESIKKLLGIDSSYTNFDQEIIMHINSAIFTLTQIGVGPTEGYSVSSEADVWTEFLGSAKDLEAVKIYVYYKVRLGFDPPSSSYVVDSITKQMQEIEWRLNVQVDKYPVVLEEVEDE